MGLKKTSFGCLMIAVLMQRITVNCENVTEPTSIPDMAASSPTAGTSAVVEPPTKEKKMATPTEKEATSTQLPDSVMTSSHSSSPVVIGSSNASVGVKVVHVTSESATEHPTHHEDKHHTHPGETHAHTNHTPHGENVTHHTMGYPHEADVDTSTDEKQRVDANWEVSIFVVIAMLGGMIVFVVFMVIKDRARTRGTNLSIKRRPVIGDDHGFIPLKEIKTEEEPKLTKAEKRQSLRNSYYGNPEDAVPLLELHIRDGETPVLNAHDESLGPKYGGPIKDRKPVLAVYGDDTQKSRENVSEEA